MAVDPRLIPALIREPGDEDTTDLRDTRAALLELAEAEGLGGTALTRLAAVVAARKGADPESSWTARLLAEGPEKCAEKFGEEAIEAIIEAVKGDTARLTSEAADVLYHLLVMLAARDVPLGEVLAELDRRAGMSGIAEKAGR